MHYFLQYFLHFKETFDVNQEIFCAFQKIFVVIQETFGALLKKDFVYLRKHLVHFLKKGFLNFLEKDFVHYRKDFALQKHIQLGKTLCRYLDFIDRKYFTLILKMKILINCTGKFCYRYENFPNTEAVTGDNLKSFTKSTPKHLCQSFFLNKAAGLRPATLLTKRLRHRCFPRTL